MINLDMVGRLPEDKQRCKVSGPSVLQKELKELITSASDTSLIKLILSEGGYGPSDHSSFYRKDIPVLFISQVVFARLSHSVADYIYDKINYPGMVNLSSLIFPVLLNYLQHLPTGYSSGSRTG